MRWHFDARSYVDERQASSFGISAGVCLKLQYQFCKMDRWIKSYRARGYLFTIVSVRVMRTYFLCYVATKVASARWSYSDGFCWLAGAQLLARFASWRTPLIDILSARKLMIADVSEVSLCRWLTIHGKLFPY